MLRVKVCGITRRQDALLACELGADALGFIFYPQSPRFIHAEQAAEIADGLPRQVMRIGVFVAPDPQEVRDALRIAGLDAVQIHGDYPPPQFAALPGRKIRALNPPPETRADDLEHLAAGADALLLDSHSRGLYGGTGKTGDWHLARELAQRRPLILAVGLNPDNVRAAVQQVHPRAVDVNSGVETAPGIKDALQLERFFQQIEDYRSDRDTDSRAGFFPA